MIKKKLTYYIVLSFATFSLYHMADAKGTDKYIIKPIDSIESTNSADSTSNERLSKTITADAAIIVDRNTGRVLFQKNADKREYPASMTKMMTCILAIESGRLNDIVTITPQAAAASDTYLTKGDKLQMSDLLYMLMLSSNNGSAVAIANHLSTKKDPFSTQMNRKARAIGMKNTHFITPNGLHHANHYSTARDMARLGIYCMRNAKFRDFVKTKQINVRWKSPYGKHIYCRNENKLLDLYNGVNGIKTGFTDQAQGCLTTSYDKNGKKLLVVVMHSKRGQQRFHDTMKLLDWAR